MRAANRNSGQEATGLEVAAGDIQVVSRCAQVLRLLSGPRPALRVADVAAELGLQRSTVHRYLTSLANAGFLERAADSSYGLGPLLVQLGTVALGGLRVLEASGPYLRQLADEAHETVVLAVWGGLGPVVARVQEDLDKLVHISVRVGSPLPLSASQAQVFLAFMRDRATVERLLGQLPGPHRAELEQQVEQVRRQGLCVNSRVIEGIRAVAAPVFNDQGDVCATLAFVGTTSSIPEDPGSGLARALAGAAGALSRQLGHTEPLPFEPATAAAGPAPEGAQS